MSGSRVDRDALGAATPEFDDPFAILEACHGRIDRFLRTLARLPDHVARHGIDAEACEAIGRIRRYFEEAGPNHHADEEVDLFPAARAAARLAGDDASLAAIDALERDHREMEAVWAALRAHLDRLAGDGGSVDAVLVRRFEALYRDHIAREEGVVFAGAKPRFGAALRAALAQAMVARRRD